MNSAQDKPKTYANSEHDHSPIVVRAIWAFLLFAVFVLVVLAYAPTTDTDSSFANPEPFTEMIKKAIGICALLSAATIGLGWIVPRFFVSSARQSLGERALSGVSSAEIASLMTAPLIARLLMFEGGTVIGLFAALIAHNSLVILPFALVSAICILSQFPSENHLKKWFEK